MDISRKSSVTQMKEAQLMQSNFFKQRKAQ